MIETVLAADLGENNIFDLDANVSLNSGSDKIWFYGKRRYSDLDTDALFRKTLNVSGGDGGISVLDAGTGTFRVVLDGDDLPAATLANDESLIFVCKLWQSSTQWETTIVRGTLRLRKEVVQATV